MNLTYCFSCLENINKNVQCGNCLGCLKCGSPFDWLLQAVMPDKGPWPKRCTSDKLGAEKTFFVNISAANHPETPNRNVTGTGKAFMYGVKFSDGDLITALYVRNSVHLTSQSTSGPWMYVTFSGLQLWKFSPLRMSCEVWLIECHLCYTYIRIKWIQTTQKR